MPKLVKILIAFMLAPIVLVALTMYLLHGAALYALVWLIWCPRRKNVLLVYSDSPVWHDYVEANILPRLPRSTVILNWSQRSTWRWYWLSPLLLQYFGGTREFNPMVLIFRPFRRVKTFRFRRAFRDYKHGNGRALESLEHRMQVAVVARIGRKPR